MISAKRGGYRLLSTPYYYVTDHQADGLSHSTQWTRGSTEVDAACHQNCHRTDGTRKARLAARQSALSESHQWTDHDRPHHYASWC